MSKRDTAAIGWSDGAGVRVAVRHRGVWERLHRLPGAASTDLRMVFDARDRLLVVWWACPSEGMKLVSAVRDKDGRWSAPSRIALAPRATDREVRGSVIDARQRRE